MIGLIPKVGEREAGRPRPAAARAARRRGPRGFTLVELLVSITVILTLAGIALVAVNATRQEARIARTKATIAKIDHLIMARYESYRTRRVPVNLTGLAGKQAAEVRYRALLYMMWMDMPERITDIKGDTNFATPYSLPNAAGRTLPYTALARQYAYRLQAQPASPDYQHGEMLYAVVTSDPEARELFQDDEVRDVDDDGWPEFVDGWGMPIYWLRWAPGFTIEAGLSDIQAADPVGAHDPFDSHRVQGNAYHLIPLIYSAGPDKKYGVNVGKELKNVGKELKFVGRNSPFDTDWLSIGGIDPSEGNAIYDNIHNHHIEQR